MATPWIAKVKSTGQLSVFLDDSITKGAWAGALTKTIAEFNRISGMQKFGVSLVTASAPPDPKGYGGADVAVYAANGPTTYKSGNEEYTLNVNGTGMSAHCQTLSFQPGDASTREHFKAFIFLPASAQINSGPASKQVNRPIGEPLRLFIAFHEFIHACGLPNAEHSHEGLTPDVFHRQPQPSAGAKPDDDRFMLAYADKTAGRPSNLFAPPITVSGRVTGLIQGVWPQKP
jgi:hypothetical protein